MRRNRKILKIENVKVFGVEESIKAAKFPMSIDSSKCGDVSNIKYWQNYGTFMYDFLNYYDTYNKDKGLNTSCSCTFCGSNKNISKSNKLGNYYCSKCNHQIQRYGKVFETKPEYILKEDYVEVVIIGDKLKKTKILKKPVHVHKNSGMDIKTQEIKLKQC